MKESVSRCLLMAADALEWHPPCRAVFYDKLEEAAMDKLLNLFEKWEDPVLYAPEFNEGS